MSSIFASNTRSNWYPSSATAALSQRALGAVGVAAADAFAGGVADVDGCVAGVAGGAAAGADATGAVLV
ncbi:MAG: hypothetical protein ACOY0T_15025 [Myxococcota bacterium]